MDLKGVAAMMALLETAYPRFYAGQVAEQKRAALALWAEALAEYPDEAVRAALVGCIKESPFPPTIADITRRIAAMRSVGEDGIEELWSKLARAVCDGYYHAKERFAELPRVCQRFAGSPTGLREMSQMDEQILHTVTRGQFMKRAQALLEQDKILRETPKHVLDLLGSPSGTEEPLKRLFEPQREEAGA